jgi:hypothetical protein
MNAIAHDTFDSVTGASAVDTSVRYLKPPRRASAGWTQCPVCSGAPTRSTPSKVVFWAGYEESSDAMGRMKEGDSVKESAMADEEATFSKLSEISPPTYVGT